MALLSDLVWYGGSTLQVVVLFLLLRGPLSRYFPLFLYCLASLVMNLSLVWIYRTSGFTKTYYTVFWGGDLGTGVLLFFLLISLASQILEKSPVQGKVVKLLTGLATVALLAPFVLFNSALFTTRWNQSVSQLLNFGAAMMVFTLWTMLVATRVRDRQLLQVSAGLGMMVAAAAIMLGVRKLTSPDDILRTISEYIYRLTQLVGPAIWCWAFRPGAVPVKKNGTETPPTIAATSSLN